MKKIVCLMLVAIGLGACGGGQKYSYVETINSVELSGKSKTEDQPAVEISAKTDYDAYCEAYKKFLISKKEAKKVMDKLGGLKYAPLPLRFTLLNKDSVEITSDVLHDNVRQVQDSLYDLVFDMK